MVDAPRTTLPNSAPTGATFGPQARPARRWNAVAVVVAGLVFTFIATTSWHADAAVRRGAALVVITLLLWISEAVPLGVVGLMIPAGATFIGVLSWNEALAAWGDPILFLFLGALLLARALEKHGVFEPVIRGRAVRRLHDASGLKLALVIVLLSGLLSMMQSNTAVAAMLLPLVVPLARTVRRPHVVLLALSFGATFGGMATPIGTPPNFIGYARMKELDPGVNFLMWLRVGLPVWIGTGLLAGAVLAIGRWAGRGDGEAGGASPAALVPGAFVEAPPPDAATRAARRWAIAAFALTVTAWLAAGFITSLAGPEHAASQWVARYLPESLPALVGAGLLFFVRVGSDGRPVLERRDFQAVDWDTLFLIAGGLCLGKVLQASGAAAELAAAIGRLELAPLAMMFGLGLVTLALSELTSNTATASLMVPIAASLAPAMHLSPVQTIWLVAMCASLGFALPVSTPPNAIIYGTGLVPLRAMARYGIVMDLVALAWVVACMRWWA